MRPYRYVLTALVIAGFAAASDASLAQQRTSGKSYLKQVGSIKLVRQRIPSRRVLEAGPPDLVLSPVGIPTKTCVGPSTLQVDFDILLLNIGGAPATLMQSPWAAWLRLRDTNWNAFSPFDLDEFVGSPPSSLPNGQFATFHISRKVKQDAGGGWSMTIQADPYNWIVESNESNNSTAYGQAQSVCK